MSFPKVIEQLKGNVASSILLKDNPVDDMDAATKQYIDNELENLSSDSLTDGSHVVSLPNLTKDETFATESYVSTHTLSSGDIVNLINDNVVFRSVTPEEPITWLNSNNYGEMSQTVIPYFIYDWGSTEGINTKHFFQGMYYANGIIIFTPNISGYRDAIDGGDENGIDHDGVWYAAYDVNSQSWTWDKDTKFPIYSGIEDYQILNGSLFVTAVQSGDYRDAAQVRNIALSTSEPSASDGAIGDICLVYEE